MKNKNILWISYYFSPIKAIGSIRNSKLAKYLSLQGNNNIYVFSTSNVFLAPKDSILKKKHKIKKIYYIPTLDFQFLKFLIIKLSKRRIKFHASSSVTQQKILQIFEKFPINLIIGEGGFLYILLGFILSLFLINKYKIQFIYTTFSPISDHFIGFLLKKVHPKIKWITDYRDLPKNFDLIVRLILKSADKVITVSNGLKKTLNKYCKNIKIIRNGFDPEDISNKQKYESRKEEFSFLYTGSLYNLKQTPEILYKTVQNLIKENQINTRLIRFIYAGRDGKLYKEIAAKYGLKKITINKGYLSRKEVMVLQRQSFFLILLTWSGSEEKGIISGKFYEYLLAKRPIICIINGERDKEIEEIFKRTRAGIVVYHNDKQSEIRLKKFIKEQYKKFLKRKKEWNHNRKEVEKFSYENIAKELNKLLCAG